MEMLKRKRITIMELLDVRTDNPTWVMDGMSLLPYLQAKDGREERTTMIQRPRPSNKSIGVKWGNNEAIIDNDWKLMSKPTQGQCDFQEPYSSMKSTVAVAPVSSSSTITEILCSAVALLLSMLRI